MSSNAPPAPPAPPPPTSNQSASAFLHLAPQSDSPYTPDEIRRLVLEYLCSCCYADSAKAFAREVDQVIKEVKTEKGSDDEENGGLTNGHGHGGEKKKEAVNGGGRNGREDMDGVEATPEPDLGPGRPFDPDGDYAMDGDELDELEEELQVEETLRVGNAVGGKAVAFDAEDGEGDEDDKDDGWPMLNREELKQVRLRRDIRDYILSGRIQSAIDLLNEHFPSVLTPSTPTPPTPSLSSSSPSKPTLAPPVTCTPQSFFVSTPPTSLPPPPSASASSPKPPLPILGSTFPSFALDLSPEVLSLNLQLQSFVELIRTANGPPSSSLSSSTPSTPTSTTTADSPSDTALAGMSASTSSIVSIRSGSLMKAIAQSQALQKSVQNLPRERGPKEKEMWEKECVDVSGLMAYTDLSICPVRGYLSQSRRETLAELINAAVLQHTNHTPLPILALASRQTTAIWGVLSEWKGSFPPSTSGNGSKDKSRSRQTHPRFDLRTFVNERL